MKKHGQSLNCCMRERWRCKSEFFDFYFLGSRLCLGLAIPKDGGEKSGHQEL
jgi:hypothetical protein